jgi:hypothetical protein
MAVAQQNIIITNLGNSSEKYHHHRNHHTLALKHEQSTIARYRLQEERGGMDVKCIHVNKQELQPKHNTR